MEIISTMILFCFWSADCCAFVPCSNYFLPLLANCCTTVAVSQINVHRIESQSWKLLLPATLQASLTGIVLDSIYKMGTSHYSVASSRCKHLEPCLILSQTPDLTGIHDFSHLGCCSPTHSDNWDTSVGLRKKAFDIFIFLKV